MMKTKLMRKPQIFIYLGLMIISAFVCVLVVRNLAGNLYFIKCKDPSRNDEEKLFFLEEKTIKFIPSNSAPHYELGKYYRKKASVFTSDLVNMAKLNQQAEGFLRKALLLQPTNKHYLSEYAHLIGYLGDNARAIKYYETAIDMAKTDELIHKSYAKWSLSQAKTVFQIDDLSFLMKMYNNPEQVIPFYEERLIGGIMAKIFVDIATREWEEALRLGIEKSNSTRRHLGDLYLMTMRPDDAIDNYRNAGDSIMLMKAYFIKHDFENVFRVVRQIIETKNRIFWSKWDEIKKFLEKVIVIKQSEYEAHYCLGKGYYQQSMFEEAIENFAQTTVLKPDHIDGRFFLAKSYEATGKTDMAINEYTNVLKLSPDHKEANQGLAKVLKVKLE